jgi:hypothetical protein
MREKEWRLPMNAKWGGFQGQSESFQEEKNFCLYQNSNPGPSIP